MKKILAFMRNERGAVTLDWVALSASVVILGVAFTYSVFGNETGSVSTLVSGFTVEMGVAANNLSGVTATPPPPLR